MKLKPSIAVKFAKTCDDVTYAEWCGMYLPLLPTEHQIERAAWYANSVLHRNSIYEQDDR